MSKLKRLSLTSSADKFRAIAKEAVSAPTPAVVLCRELFLSLEASSSEGGRTSSSSGGSPKPTLSGSLAQSLTSGIRYVSSDLSVDGLYRASDSKKFNTKSKKCEAALRSGGKVTDQDFKDAVGKNSGMVAATVINILMSCEPLVPYSLHDEAIRCETEEDVTKFIRSYEKRADVWSSASYDFFGSFMIHLKDVSSFAHKHGMEIDQLAQVLCNVILRQDDGRPTSYDVTVSRKRVTRLLLSHADSLFGDREEFMWGFRSAESKRSSSLRTEKSSFTSEVDHRQRLFDNSILGRAVSPLDELQTLLKASAADEKPGRWYIVPASFVHDWLAYVDAKKKHSKTEKTAAELMLAEEEPQEDSKPRPTKLDNSSLLEAEATTQLWRVKIGLRKASDRHPGDYRLVNRQTYEAYCDLYPGSGPTIYVEDYHKDNIYEWYIDQSAVLEAQGAVLHGPEMQRNTLPSASVVATAAAAATTDFFEDIVKATEQFFDGIFSGALFGEPETPSRPSAADINKSDYLSMLQK